MKIEETKKASMGDPSEIPSPTTVKAKARKGDKMAGEKTSMKQGSSDESTPNNKKTTVAELASEFGVDEDVLEALLDKLNAGQVPVFEAEEDDDEDYEEEDDMEDDEDDDSEDKMEAAKSKAKMKKEDLDLDEDLEALFGTDDDLNESFKLKAKTIFEAAITSSVNKRVDAIYEAAKADLATFKQNYSDSLVEKIDSFLNYAVENWLEENKLEVEKGLRNEITEDFMGGLQKLFAENYIEVPEDRLNIVQELSDKVEVLEARLNKTLAENIELAATVEDYEREITFYDVAENMTDADADRLRELSENVEFENSETFRKKLLSLKEGYFKEEVTVENEFDFEEDPITEDLTEEAYVDPSIRNYMAAIGRTTVKNKK